MDFVALLIGLIALAWLKTLSDKISMLDRQMDFMREICKDWTQNRHKESR